MNTVQVAVESKWADSAHCKSESISQDLIRLVLVKRQNPAARCIFLLAGSATKLTSVLDLPPFTKSSKKNIGLRANLTETRITFDRERPTHMAAFSEAIRDWREVSNIPASFVAKSYGLHPNQTDAGTVRFQAIAWEVTEVCEKDLKGANAW
ncbi:hypothetical protein ABFG95_06155 [Achromobacter sp. HNDS-1]|uniref:Uncharacterized protein n=1 Tax=Achromobacter sp. HNDS-1 TaxID=3151598 RepID=A0AAU7LEH8_9BURK